MEPEVLKMLTHFRVWPLNHSIMLIRWSCWGLPDTKTAGERVSGSRGAGKRRWQQLSYTWQHLHKWVQLCHTPNEITWQARFFFFPML